VIRGDDPQVMNKKIYPTTTVEFSKKIKKEIPDIKIYGGIDQ
jgi:methylenetetrahydrofolate reductase (NADPH)